jgi:hypothetical protein
MHSPRLPHAVFARVVLAEDFADLLAKPLVAGGRRLLAAFLRFSPVRFRARFAHCRPSPLENPH